MTIKMKNKPNDSDELYWKSLSTNIIFPSNIRSTLYISIRTTINVTWLFVNKFRSIYDNWLKDKKRWTFRKTNLASKSLNSQNAKVQLKLQTNYTKLCKFPSIKILSSLFTKFLAGNPLKQNSIVMNFGAGKASQKSNVRWEKNLTGSRKEISTPVQIDGKWCNGKNDANEQYRGVSYWDDGGCANDGLLIVQYHFGAIVCDGATGSGGCGGRQSYSTMSGHQQARCAAMDKGWLRFGHTPQFDRIR